MYISIIHSGVLIRVLIRSRGFPCISACFTRKTRLRAFCELLRDSGSFWLQRFRDVFRDDLQRLQRAYYAVFPRAGVLCRFRRFAAFPCICPFSRVSCLYGRFVPSARLSLVFPPPVLRARAAFRIGCSGLSGPVLRICCSGFLRTGSRRVVSRFCPIPAGDIMSTDRAASGMGFRGGLPRQEKRSGWSGLGSTGLAIGSGSLIMRVRACV